MYIFMSILKVRAIIGTYLKNTVPLVSSARNIDILSGSNRSGFEQFLSYMVWTVSRQLLVNLP